MKHSDLPLRVDATRRVVASSVGSGGWLFTLTNEGGPYLAVARDADRYRIRVHGVADYLVDQREVVAEPATGDLGEIEATYELDVRPVLHQLDGNPALHASAVASDEGALAFAGPSCAGKSTMAALMSKLPGFRLVADDCLPLELDETTVRAKPTARCVRLRATAAESLRETEIMQFAKYIAAREAESKAQPLRAIFALKQADTVSIKPMSQREGMAFVAGHLQRLDPSDPELLRSEFNFVAAVVRMVTVATLSYPHSFDCTLIALEIEKHLAAS